MVTPPSQGNLITVGGIGDNPANPALPASNDTAQDDELYDLRPFIRPGATQVRLDFANPTANNSVFLSVLTLSGDATLGKASAQAMSTGRVAFAKGDVLAGRFELQALLSQLEKSNMLPSHDQKSSG